MGSGTWVWVPVFKDLSICSHRGNKVFPRWELLESRKESVSIAVADAEKLVSGRRESRKGTLACPEIFVFYQKPSIPPVNGLEAPKIKDSLIFIPPLIPPVISPISLPSVISSGVERSLHALRLVEMTGEIWEGLKTSLPCSNPFIQRASGRFREG